MSTLHYYRLLMPSHPARTEERIEIRRSDEMAHMQALIQPFNCDPLLLQLEAPDNAEQGWLSGSLVMLLNKSYGMFWVQTQSCTPEQLEKKCCH